VREGVLTTTQIELHPYVFRDQLPTLAYCAKHKIVIEAYSTLMYASPRPRPVPC
jgi:diketogulonate reductase-like aldo/keto reductase